MNDAGDTGQWWPGAERSSHPLAAPLAPWRNAERPTENWFFDATQDVAADLDAQSGAARSSSG